MTRRRWHILSWASGLLALACAALIPATFPRGYVGTVTVKAKPRSIGTYHTIRHRGALVFVLWRSIELQSEWTEPEPVWATFHTFEAEKQVIDATTFRCEDGRVVFPLWVPAVAAAVVWWAARRRLRHDRHSRGFAVDPVNDIHVSEFSYSTPPLPSGDVTGHDDGRGSQRSGEVLH